MADSRFLQNGFDKRLSHAIEEAGEFLAAAGKTQRWGPMSVNPLLPPAEQETNLEWLKRERASYLRAMVPEGLSQIEKQSMEAMDNAAAEIDRLNLAIRSAYVTLEKSPGFAAQMPAFLLHIIRGGTTQEFDAAITKEQNDGQ